jgi:CheY-like chemotaxis protein
MFHVLIADHRAQLRSSLCSILQVRNYIVQEAVTGEQAWDILRTSLHPLIVCLNPNLLCEDMPLLTRLQCDKDLQSRHSYVLINRTIDIDEFLQLISDAAHNVL